jgi:M6 family metalloprotease-like protein
MKRIGIALVALTTGCASGPRTVSGPPPLPEFRTVETAIAAQIKRGAVAASDQPGYLGLLVAPGPRGRLVVADVAPDSPSAKAGLKAGDLLLEAGGDAPADAEELRDAVHGSSPGEPFPIAVEREGKRLQLTVTLGAVSRPKAAAERRAVLGLTVGDAGETGAPVTRVSPGLPAERAGIRTGDQIVEVDGRPLAPADRLADRISEKKPGDTVSLLVRRGEKTEEKKLTLAADAPAGSDGFFRGGSAWRKEVYRLAIVGMEYPDVKHNAKVSPRNWEEALFSKGTYKGKTNATGQSVFGSMNDYYQELSTGAFRVEGKMFDWVEAAKKRLDYSPGTGTGMRNRTELLVEALDKLLARDGKDALKEFDGIFFLYAGDRVQTSRGGLYWPHRGSVTHQGKRWPYFIVQEGASRMSSISVICHEFGHMLGLPDQYARPENPGSEGLGGWCAMSNENGSGRPQHICAWCKEHLGWLKPAVIDPTVKQRLVLAPVEESPRECFKVLVRPDGSEYFLLENRRKKGFDQDLRGEGLLIWRVVRGKTILEESHGVEGPSGPGVFLDSVPYPSGSNDAFTPFTTPSSRSQIGGGLPVFITNIRREKDGKISFWVGFEYQ